MSRKSNPKTGLNSTRDLPPGGFFFAPGSIERQQRATQRWALVARAVLWVMASALVVFLVSYPILWALEKSGRFSISSISTREDISMTAQTETMTADIPVGYWEDAHGNLVPESKVKDIDKLRHDVVTQLCRQAETMSKDLGKFKLDAMQEVAALVSTSMEQYGVRAGGNKGNVTLVSYDGRFKLVRQMQDRLVFGEQLMAAKELIDQCVHKWSDGANDNIRALVNHAFQTDKTGKINTGRVLGLRRLDIKDATWQLAMEAISDSIQTASTKPYVRFYRRDDATRQYLPINLDVAAV